MIPKNIFRNTQLMLFILQLFAFTAVAQKNNIDSLKKVLITQKEDTAKLHTLARICVGFFEAYNWDSIAPYAKIQFALASKINAPKEIALSYKSLGYSDYGINNFNGAFENFTTALRMMKELNDQEGIATTSWLLAKINYQLGQYATALKNVRAALEIVQNGDNISLIAGCYYDHGLYYEVLHDYTQSLKYYYLALKMQEKLGTEHYGKDKFFSVISNTYCSIGNICILQNNNAEALHNLTLAREHREKSSRKVGLGYIANCFGEVYLKQGKYTMALQQQFAAMELWKKYADLDYQSWAIPHTYRNIGHIYKKQGEEALQKAMKDTAQKYLSLALENYTLSLNGYNHATDKSGIPAAHVNLGKLYLVLHNTKKAGYYLKMGLKLSIAAGDRENVRESYLSLSQLDSINVNISQAYEHYKKYILCRDSLVNEEGMLKSESYKLQYEFDKKQDEIKLLTAENKINAVLASRQELQKKIAIAGIGLVVILGGYVFLRFRKRKSMQSQQALMDQRQNISRDLHDEVGATLSGISMYSHLVKSSVENNEVDAAKHAASIIQESAADMVTKLNDIIWLINPETSSLQDLITKLKDYAQKLCLAKNMEADVQIIGEVEKFTLPIDARKNIYLFCREAINNGVKYSDATILYLEFKLQTNSLKIIILDNGVGFDLNNIKRGNGLDNMQKRADDIGAVFSIQSEPQKGCAISLEVKI